MICPCCNQDINKWKDERILNFCKDGKSLSSISRYIGDAIPNISRRVVRLEKEGRLKVEKFGKGKPNICKFCKNKQEKLTHKK